MEHENRHVDKTSFEILTSESDETLDVWKAARQPANDRWKRVELRVLTKVDSRLRCLLESTIKEREEMVRGGGWVRHLCHDGWENGAMHGTNVLSPSGERGGGGQEVVLQVRNDPRLPQTEAAKL